MTIILSFALFLVSAFITRLLVVNSYRFSKMDIPNERSSHLTPTPRGGGIAFVATSLVGILLLLLNSELDRADLLALCFAGAIVAIAGHLDDRQKISGAMVRLIFHALGAIILIVGIGFPSLPRHLRGSCSTGITTTAVISFTTSSSSNNFASEKNAPRSTFVTCRGCDTGSPITDPIRVIIRDPSQDRSESG